MKPTTSVRRLTNPGFPDGMDYHLCFGTDGEPSRQRGVEFAELAAFGEMS